MALPFGYEFDPLKEVASKDTTFVALLGGILLDLSFPDNSQSYFYIYRLIWAETKEPINEVTLWDWSSIVAALYKAEIARCVLTGEQRNPKDKQDTKDKDKQDTKKDIRWRLLSIRTNGLEYFLSAPSIPDLKARQELHCFGMPGTRCNTYWRKSTP